jgi:streptogramin lyase
VLVAGTVVFLGTALPGRAVDPIGQVTVVATGGVTPGFPADGRPGAIITGPDGNIWFSLAYTGIARLNTDGTVSAFSGITSDSIFRMANGPDNNIWFTEFNPPSVVAEINTQGAITEVVKSGENGFPDGNIEGITLGPDGNMWVARPFGGNDTTGAITRITPGGAFNEFEATYAGSTQPRELTAGPDGNIWFTDSEGAIVRADPATGAMTVMATAGITPGFSNGAGPSGIVSGADGNLWFLEQGIGRVARITTSGTVTEFSDGIPSGAFLSGITTACDGNIWVSQGQEDQSESAILRVTTDGVVTRFTDGIPAGANVFGIASGPDDNVWFVGLTDPGRVMRIGTGVSCHAPLSPSAPVETTVVDVTPRFTG